MTLLHPSNSPTEYVASAFGVGGASREQLLREAFTNNAPHTVIRALFGLHSPYFFSLAEVSEELSPGRWRDADHQSPSYQEV